ncbi:hypothetical protein MRX96_058431 [Rhipicephalus microplus]
MFSPQAALAPPCQEDLKQKRRKFEEELRTALGVALLDAYHKYLLRVQQHHVTNVKVPQLLEQAVVQLKTNTELFNDVRYIRIWIRHATLSPEPLASFKAMFKTGIGLQHGEFYATWAQQLEAYGDTSGASRILQEGIRWRATPASRLEAALRHLKARVSCQVTLDQFEQVRMDNIRAQERQITFAQQLKAEQDRCRQLEAECLQREKCDLEEVEALKQEVLQMCKELQLLHRQLAENRSGSRDHAAVTSQVRSD